MHSRFKGRVPNEYAEYCINGYGPHSDLLQNPDSNQTHQRGQKPSRAEIACVEDCYNRDCTYVVHDCQRQQEEFDLG